MIKAHAYMVATLIASVALAEDLTPVAEIITQDDAAVEILRYSAEYESSSTQFSERGIHHKLTYKNIGDRPIVAIQFGLASFDAFNDFIGIVNGVTLEYLPTEGAKDAKGNLLHADTGQWVQKRHGDFAFHTGFAWVNKIRFQDGEVWVEDRGTITARLREIEESFDASMLEEEPNDD